MITSMTLSTKPSRPKPKLGDVRTTKLHGRQVRVPLYVTDTRGRIIGRNCTGGRPRFEWVALTAQNIAKYHLEYLKLEIET